MLRRLVGTEGATLILGWPSGILAGIAALVALFFAATGRQGRLLLQLTGASIVLGVLSILIGSIEPDLDDSHGEYTRPTVAGGSATTARRSAPRT